MDGIMVALNLLKGSAFYDYDKFFFFTIRLTTTNEYLNEKVLFYYYKLLQRMQRAF